MSIAPLRARVSSVASMTGTGPSLAAGHDRDAVDELHLGDHLAVIGGPRVLLGRPRRPCRWPARRPAPGWWASSWPAVLARRYCAVSIGCRTPAQFCPGRSGPAARRRCCCKAARRVALPLVAFSSVAAVPRKPPGSTWTQLFTVTDGMSGEDRRLARATTRTRDDRGRDRAFLQDVVAPGRAAPRGAVRAAGAAILAATPSWPG